AIAATKRGYLAVLDQADRLPWIPPTQITKSSRDRGEFIRVVGQLPDKYLAETRDFAKHPYPDLYDNGIIQNHQLKILREAVHTDPALSDGGFDKARALESIALDKLDGQFAQNRKQFKAALAQKDPAALREDARKLATALDFFVGGDQIRRER